MQSDVNSSGEDVECFVPHQNRFYGHNGQVSGRGNKDKQVGQRYRSMIDCETGRTDEYKGLLFNEYEVLAKIERLENEQIMCQKTIQNMHRYVNRLEEKVDNYETLLENQADHIQMLSYQSIENEARSRRKNVIIWGVSEKLNLPTDTLVLNFLEDELAINRAEICVERAYRLGVVSRYEEGREKKRPIVVCFTHHSYTEIIMRRAYMLKGSPFGIDRDNPREIAAARKLLHGSKEAKRARQCNHKVKIEYPARLLVNGKLICDKFPSWQKYVYGHRLDHDNNTLRNMTYKNEDSEGILSREIGVRKYTDSLFEKDTGRYSEESEAGGALSNQSEPLADIRRTRISQKMSVDDSNGHENPSSDNTIKTCITRGGNTEKNRKYSLVPKSHTAIYPNVKQIPEECPNKSNTEQKINPRQTTHVITEHELERPFTRYRSRSSSKYRSMEIPFYCPCGVTVLIESQDCVTRL